MAWADKNEGWIRLAMGERARAAESLEAARAHGERTGESFLEGICSLGVAAARGAGIPVIAVAFGYAKVPVAELGADAVIGHFDELREAIRRLA